MQRTYINDLSNHIDQEVKVQGWLQTLRDQKKMQFLILRDRTGLVQVAHYRPANEELASQISALGNESALTVTGKVVKNEVVKLGGLEIQLETLTVENAAEIPMPYDPFDDENMPAVDFRMDWRYLDLRESDGFPRADSAGACHARILAAGRIHGNPFTQNDGFSQRIGRGAL